MKSTNTTEEGILSIAVTGVVTGSLIHMTQAGTCCALRMRKSAWKNIHTILAV